jgi:hypothetical protein
MSNTREWMTLGLYGVNIQVNNGGVLLWKTTNGIPKILKLLFDTDIIYTKIFIYYRLPPMLCFPIKCNGA